MPESSSAIAARLQVHAMQALGNTADVVGNVASKGTEVVSKGVEGSLNAGIDITEASTKAAGVLGVAGIETVSVVGVTAAKAVAGTAETMYNTAATITAVAAAKGAKIAADSIAMNKAKTEAINDKDNLKKRNEAAKTEEDLRITKQKYEAKQAALRAEAKNETVLINTQIKAVKSKATGDSKLTDVQSNALIKASKAKEKVMKAQDTAERIELDANQYYKCRKVLQIAAKKPLAIQNKVPNNTDKQKQFCKYQKICNRTGKPLSMFNVFGDNEKFCGDIGTNYATFETMSEEKETVGGRKTSRKKNTRRPKKNTRRPKKNTRKNKKNTRNNKKNTRRPKKNTRRPKKKTRRTKRRSI
jgi:hypothetical protein